MKRIGIMVDGSAEMKAWKPFFKKHKDLFEKTTIIGPIYVDIQPKAYAGKIAASIIKQVPQLKAKKSDEILVLIDLEDQNKCLINWVKELEKVIRTKEKSIPIHIVIKNKTFENWLISDISPFENLKEFKLTQGFRKKVEPNKADNVQNAGSMISGIKVKGSYLKGVDDKKILERAHPDRIGQNSRSFRRLLRLLGHSSYMDQSKKP